MTPPEPRFPSITETMTGEYTLTIGDTAIDLDSTELCLLMAELHDVLETPTPTDRLRESLGAAAYEVREMLENSEHLTRAYSLTTDDLVHLLDLQRRVASPWE